MPPRLPSSLAALLIGALVIVGCGGDEERLAVTTPETESAGSLVLTYEEPGEEVEDAATLLVDSRRIDDVVDSLDGALDLPRDIGVRVADEEEWPYFDPEAPEIVMSYGFVADVLEVFEGQAPDGAAEEHADGALAFAEWVLYHELGHALISELELPVVGREEDAADSLATVLATRLVDDGGAVALSSAIAFLLMAQEVEEVGEDDYFDEHSLDEQRFARIVCLVYGSDPRAHSDVVEEGVLPEDRADGCVEEYEGEVASWSELLEVDLAT